MPADFKNYHVAAEHAGLALVAALRQFLPGEPWSAVRRLIENRHVQINGNLCLDEGRKLQAGDVVKVWDEPRNAPPDPEDIKILFQDAHLIVVEKPAGVTTERHAEEQHWPAAPQAAAADDRRVSGADSAAASVRGSGAAASRRGRRGCGSFTAWIAIPAA